MTAAFEFLEPVVDRLNVPRRIADGVRRMVAVLPRLESGRPGRFAGTGLFRAAQQLLEMSRRAHGAASDDAAAALAAEGERLRKRRRRRPRRKLPGTDTAPPDERAG